MRTWLVVVAAAVLEGCQNTPENPGSLSEASGLEQVRILAKGLE